MKKALITGINGSCASYLAEYLIENQNIHVQGLSRWHTDRNIKNLESVELYECDLLDLSNIIRVLDKAQPDYIFHLASNANVKLSFTAPSAILNNNINGTLNLLEALRITNLKPILQYCGTSEVYGQVDVKDIPINESQNLDPVNVYAISKLTQEKLVKSYSKSYQIPIVITRAFGYINPRRPDIFSSAFAKQIVDIEKGHKQFLSHGNLDSIRTLLDVRDVCHAYWLASQKCVDGEAYNIGSEDPVSVKDFLNILLNKSKIKIKTFQDVNLIRPVDVTLQIPDVSKFKNKTNFIPKYTLSESVEFLLKYYRN